MYKRICFERLDISRSSGSNASKPNQSTMKVMIVALALVAVATAASVGVEEPVPIIRADYNQSPEGSYTFGFETGNGIVRNENGELKQVVDEENKPHDVVVVRGSYTYKDTDGKVETINYFADETGYHAEGDSVPKVARR